MVKVRNTGESLLGCSVNYIYQLDELTVPKYEFVTAKPPWTGASPTLKYVRKRGKSVDIRTDEGLKILKAMVRHGKTDLTKILNGDGNGWTYGGIAVFVDTVAYDEYRQGIKLAKFLRDKGQVVEETRKYMNQTTHATCKMWIWYFNETKDAGKHTLGTAG